MNKEITYEFLKENDLIIMEAIIGSQAYGTNTPESDVDKKFIYILPEDNILGSIGRDYDNCKQVNVNADFVGYEIGRFLELLESNNPTVLELLNTPEDCLISKKPIFDLILDNQDRFISKVCKDSFGGYARQQISKAKGMNKMQNWEKEDMVRKDILDFCYVVQGHRTYDLKEFLKERDMDQKFIGVVKIPNAREMYSAFYDHDAALCFSDSLSKEDREHNKKRLKELGRGMGLGYKGIIKKGEGTNVAESNQLRLSTIPKGINADFTFAYNKDGYTTHCNVYKKYSDWIKNRNTQRWVDVESHGQQIDGKNLMHCKRLIQMSVEIAEGKGLIIRRPDAQELLDIRRGKVSLEELISWSEEQIANMDELFKNSDLPDKPQPGLANELLLEIRKSFYKK